MVLTDDTIAAIEWLVETRRDWWNGNIPTYEVTELGYFTPLTLHEHRVRALGFDRNDSIPIYEFTELSYLSLTGSELHCYRDQMTEELKLY